MTDILEPTSFSVQTTQEVDAYLGDDTKIVATERLHLTLPLLQAQRLLRAQGFPILRELVLNVVGVVGDADSNLVDFPPSIFPQLKSLTIECDNLLNLLPGARRIAPWHNLTSLNIKLLLPVSMALETLANCPNLEQSTLYIQCGPPSLDQQPKVQCSSLSDLHLEFGGADADECQYFFQNINLPKLVNLTFGNREMPWFAGPFQALTSGSPLLAKLTMTELRAGDPETEKELRLTFQCTASLKTFNPGTISLFSEDFCNHLRQTGILIG
ncbi:hypothetical protein BDN72DRAFT_294276 [Pluteus cervinus]|uniref:Uncharacterized protein n=1 Tax=Pluteus cervinus TaxID=181527 RepID=A0ACD3B4Y0_9AGAR|nr:hypothetical protein BDN72DRAFT_294276 [Pluteus cervinus]